MNQQKKISKDIFIFSLLTVITVITWGLFDTYRAWQKKDIPTVLQQQIEPLNPQLDIQVLEILSTRTKIE